MSEQCSCSLSMGSGSTLARRFRKTVEASSKDTPCLLKLAAALPGSHVNWTSSSIQRGAYHPPAPQSPAPRVGQHALKLRPRDNHAIAAVSFKRLLGDTVLLRREQMLEDCPSIPKNVHRIHLHPVVTVQDVVCAPSDDMSLATVL